RRGRKAEELGHRRLALRGVHRRQGSIAWVHGIEHLLRAREVSRLERTPRREREIELRRTAERTKPLELFLGAFAVSGGGERVMAGEARAIGRPVTTREGHELASRAFVDDTVRVREEGGVRERALDALEG